MHFGENRKLLPFGHYPSVEKIEDCIVVFVHKVARRHVVLVFRLRQVIAESTARPYFNLFKSCAVPLNIRMDIERLVVVAKKMR